MVGQFIGESLDEFEEVVILGGEDIECFELFLLLCDGVVDVGGCFVCFVGWEE